MDVKEFDDFFGDQLAIFPFSVQIPSKIVEIRFSVQNAKFRDSVRFPSKTILFSPYM